MARARPEFAEFVATLSADDAELLTDLKSAETATKVSATRMQANLSKVSMSAGNLSSALGTVSQAGAAAGGSLGGMVGQAVAATQALAGMVTVISGPVGLIVGLGALTIGVVAYRQEAAGWLNSMLESIGVLEDLSAALAKADAQLATKETRLKKQTDAEARFNAELEQRQRILTATRLKDPELLALRQRDVALERRIDQAREAGAGEKAISILFDIAAKNEEIIDTKKKQADFDKRMLEIERQRLAGLVERERRETAIATLQKTRLQAAQQLLVGIGAAVPSEFITDPVLQRIAKLGESLAGGTQAPARGGAFALLSTPSPLSAVRGGEVLGKQQLTAAEKTAKFTAEQLLEIKQVRGILERLEQQGQTRASGSFLPITGGP